ncbi:meteorin-like protein [Tribolium castaneum]|nr:PREDICTED: meteorin-like protein [Tribolium castaneum]|eukprot:XP_969763.1 PREDICTED: meteorin-like protein [Tribolium castaneum]
MWMIFVMWPRTVLMDYIFLLAFIGFCGGAIMGDECDWTGSGLSSSATGRGVTPVYLRCSAGRVIWLYPRGALRVLLRLPGQDREFRACIKVHPDEKKEPAARLFLEGPRSLLPLYADPANKAIRCFISKNGQAAIYVEASDVDAITKRVAEIEYDLQALPKGVKGFDPTEECRPCTNEELAHAFCTSDLVTRGVIHGVENHEDLEISQMSVKVTKLIRHTVDDAFTVDTNSISPEEDTPLEKITLHVAQHCGVSHGLGEFVFMARRKLGDLTLQCAPRLEDWALLVNQLSEEGKAHCVLRS